MYRPPNPKKNSLDSVLEAVKGVHKRIDDVENSFRQLARAHNYVVDKMLAMEADLQRLSGEKTMVQVSLQRMRAEILMTAVSVSDKKDVENVIETAHKMLRYVETGNPDIHKEGSQTFH